MLFEEVQCQHDLQGRERKGCWKVVKQPPERKQQTSDLQKRILEPSLVILEPPLVISHERASQSKSWTVGKTACKLGSSFWEGVRRQTTSPAW